MTGTAIAIVSQIAVLNNARASVSHPEALAKEPMNSDPSVKDVGGIITAVAGNGTSGFSGDGGPATSASLGGSSGVAVDSAGNLYIADTSNARIRKVSGGTITTVAGGGNSLGDGGPATSALLSLPSGVAADSAGNLYMADTMNQSYGRVRRVAPNGIISTIAGNGQFHFGGDAGPSRSASLNRPYGVALDATGAVYIADTYNNGGRGFSGDEGPASSASLALPSAVAVDVVRNIYIADTSNNRIRRVSPGGAIATIAGTGTPGFSGDGGPAASASLDGPFGIGIPMPGIG